MRLLHQCIPRARAVAELRGLNGVMKPQNQRVLCRLFSSSDDKKPPFRRPSKPKSTVKKDPKGYFPFGNDRLRVYKDNVVDLDDIPLEGEMDENGTPADSLTADFGPHLANAVRKDQAELYKHKGRRETADDFLRAMDYLTSEDGSTEDLVGERRALAFECETDEEREKFMKDIDEMVEKQRIKDLGLEAEDYPFDDMGDTMSGVNDPRNSINLNQLAHGEWGEMLIRVDRNIKLWRGGRIQSYRALVIGGNLNGCAGFGTGKAPGAREAVLAASRKCKRNIFFVDRYQTNSLTRDLVGRSNSCKMVLRATNRGLRGNDLACAILKYFGITNASCKAVHGQRSQYNVVRATFKALMTHESMEEVSRKRGRRIVSLDRGRRLHL